MDAVYMMGFDAWSDGSDQAEYLKDCRKSAKYRSGQWLVLCADDLVVSSLLVHTFPPWGSWQVRGIGSVATEPTYRKRGFASQLIEMASAALCARNRRLVILLYSDIDAEFYRRLAFVELSSEFQLFQGSKLLARMSREWDEALFRKYQDKIPGYF